MMEPERPTGPRSSDGSDARTPGAWPGVTARARCNLDFNFLYSTLHDCTSPRAERLPLVTRQLCQLQLSRRRARVCVSCPSLSTQHGSTPLCVAHWSPPSATLPNSQGGAGVSSSKCRPLGLCCGANTPTGGLLDQLGGTAAPPATCGSAYARCDWGRAS